MRVKTHLAVSLVVPMTNAVRETRLQIERRGCLPGSDVKASRDPTSMSIPRRRPRIIERLPLRIISEICSVQQTLARGKKGSAVRAVVLEHTRASQTKGVADETMVAYNLRVGAGRSLSIFSTLVVADCHIAVTIMVTASSEAFKLKEGLGPYHAVSLLFMVQVLQLQIRFITIPRSCHAVRLVDNYIYNGTERTSARIHRFRVEYAHRRFIVNPVWTSVSVRVSIECTPGASARKSIRTDWHVDGRSGLKAKVGTFSISHYHSRERTTHPTRTRFSSGMNPGGWSPPFRPPSLVFRRRRRSSG